MKTKLFTKNISLGLLMTLVLAFGVQVTADALSALGRDSTNDLTRQTTNTNFTITFTATLQDIDADPNATPATPDYYKKEAVKISVSGAKINRIGTTDITPTSSYTLKETTTAPQLIGSNDIRCIASSYGIVTITISDATTDRRSTDTKPPNITHTIYVTRPSRLFNPTQTITLANAPNKVGKAYNDEDQQIYGGDHNHFPVVYTVSDNGQLFVKVGNRTQNLVSGTTTTSTAAPVYLQRGNTTYTVEAQVTGGRKSSAVYIYGTPTLTMGGVPENSSVPGQKLSNALTATINDGASGTPVVAGVPVKFELTNKGISGGLLIPRMEDPVTTVIDSKNVEITDPESGDTIYARTNSSGIAGLDYQVGTASGDHVITVSAPDLNLTEIVKIATTTSPTTRQLSKDGNQQRSGTDIFDLVALVKNGEQAEEGVLVRFTTTRGILTNTPANPSAQDNTEDPDTLAAQSGKDIVDKTDTQGKAKVIFNAGDSTTGAEVVASISVIENDRVIDLQEVIFSIRGGTDPDNGGTDNGTDRGTLNIALSGTGSTRTVTVTALNNGIPAPGISVLLNVNNGATLSRTSGPTPITSTLTLPTTAGNYILTATTTHPDYTGDTETVTVTLPGTLLLEELGARAANGGQSIRVTVREANGSLASGAVTVTLSGAISRTVPTSNGTGAAIITVPTTGGTVTLSATGYTTSSYTFSTTGQPTTPTTTPTGPAGVADSVRIASNPFPSGPANTRLAQPLRVQVLDANNRGVASVRVTFEVVSGQGRLSQRGNGRAVRANTDRNGNASANYTPLADGTSRVRATAAGVTQTVTFTITAGAAAPSPEETTPSETDVTPSREINPDVQVNASQRPPMLWVDGGSIYALVGADVQKFAPGVDNALNIAVAGGKIYWTEQTGDSAGTINSANLNGSNVKELKSIMAVPMGIAVDTAGDKLYWTNSRGRIQSLNADGSGRVENVMLDLPGPRDIAVARGNLYWTQYDATEGEGNVGIVNPNSAQKVARYTSTGSDAPGSLTVAGGKIYWTEMTGTSSGTINSANLNGTNAMELASIRAVPIGIAVDAARSKLYWTNSRGRVQSANLDGSKIQNVVDGLGSPGDMVLSNSIAAPAATATPTTPTTASNKYDVNGDGSVDSKDVDALIVAVAAGVTDAKYDVNGDGKVDIFDVSAVSSKRDDGAASAPTLLGTKLSIVQIDRLQEQIDLLVASNDRSPDALRILTYLHQLIVMARPEKTQLLANYPNPFNPETWIPYELATDTTVKITIYNTHGVVIRTLALGHQSAGYYTGRDRAAYWDGRNALGEQVASGIYFYQFETDEISSMRKMVILK